MIVETGEPVDPAALLELLTGKVPDWWLPDAIVRVDQMPLSASGKIDKRQLRAIDAQGRLMAESEELQGR